MERPEIDMSQIVSALGRLVVMGASDEAAMVSFNTITEQVGMRPRQVTEDHELVCSAIDHACGHVRRISKSARTQIADDHCLGDGDPNVWATAAKDALRRSKNTTPVRHGSVTASHPS